MGTPKGVLRQERTQRLLASALVAIGLLQVVANLQGNLLFAAFGVANAVIGGYWLWTMESTSQS